MMTTAVMKMIVMMIVIVTMITTGTKNRNSFFNWAWNIFGL